MAFGYKRIFAALDGASTQRAVMERAIALAEEEHAELTFGHVIDSVPYEASGVDFELLCNEGKIRIETDLADLLEKVAEGVSQAIHSSSIMAASCVPVRITHDNKPAVQISTFAPHCRPYRGVNKVSRARNRT